MASAPPGYVILGHMLFELCRATGRPPPSYDIKQEKGKYTVDVTVGNEGPVRGSTHVNCMEAKGKTKRLGLTDFYLIGGKYGTLVILKI